jgi:hypothetical protein
VRDGPVTVTTSQSPLLQMVHETPTDYWSDSCAVDELADAVERGATGATSNPTWSEVELMGAVRDLVLPDPDRRVERSGGQA